MCLVYLLLFCEKRVKKKCRYIVGIVLQVYFPVVYLVYSVHFFNSFLFVKVVHRLNFMTFFVNCKSKAYYSLNPVISCIST